MRATLRAASVALVLASPAFPSAQGGPLPPQEPTALVNANVVNVRDGTIIPKATVLIRDGKIVFRGIRCRRRPV